MNVLNYPNWVAQHEGTKNYGNFQLIISYWICKLGELKWKSGKLARIQTQFCFNICFKVNLELEEDW